jgi:hypothetical protein
VSDPVAVLVVPAPGDPGRLVWPGACGPAPAVVESGDVCAHDWHREWKPRSEQAEINCYMCRYPKQALPLWWDGALVPEGWDRACRALVSRCNELAPNPLDPEPPRFPTFDDVEALAAFLVPLGLASRVVLLDRIDGRLVERAP